MADPVTEFEQYGQELLAILAGDDPVAVLQAGHDRVHLDQFRRGLG
jgi:hypothetical protein